MTQALLAEILLRITFWVCFLYPLLGVFWPWWKSAIGISVIVKAEALAAVLLPAQLHYAFGWDTATPAWQWYTVAAFAVIPAALLWRAAAIYTAQRRGAHG